MTDEIITWKFVEENYPDFHNSGEINWYKATKGFSQKFDNIKLMRIYQKAIVNYMNKQHVKLVQKDLEGFIG